MKLRSTNMLLSLREIFDSNDADAIDAEFNQTPDKHHFQNYFRAMFAECVLEGEFADKRNAEFLRLIQEVYNIQLPSKKKLSGSNTFRDPTDFYFTIFQTNICYHAYRRMRAFCLHISENNDWPMIRWIFCSKRIQTKCPIHTSSLQFGIICNAHMEDPIDSDSDDDDNIRLSEYKRQKSGRRDSDSSDGSFVMPKKELQATHPQIQTVKNIRVMMMMMIKSTSQLNIFEHRLQHIPHRTKKLIKKVNFDVISRASQVSDLMNFKFFCENIELVVGWCSLQ